MCLGRRVVVQALLHRDTRRRVAVAGQKRENVVSTTVSRLDNQTQIRRQGTGVGCTRSLFVRVRAGKVVGQLTRALEHLAFVVRTILVLNIRRHSLHLIHRVRHTHQVAPRNAVQRVAGTAHLLVHLEAAADGCMVKRLEPLKVLPRVRGRVQTLVGQVGAGRLKERPLAVHVLVPHHRSKSHGRRGNS